MLMEIYALIGPSGTGKSHRALKIAHENGIDYIIDDGILIYQTKILAGVSAKNANTKMEAVKRAIFESESHKNEVKNAIFENNVEKILIIGTSERMVNKIIKRLAIGDEYQKISIFDIASEHEINEAISMRKNQGIHAVPLPTFEVKKHFSGILRNPIKLIFKIKGTNETKTFEKTLIRPNFSYIGKFFISERAMLQIIKNEIDKFDEIVKVFAIDIRQNKDGIEVDVSLGMKVCRLHETAKYVQKNISEAVENMTLINTKNININIIKVYAGLKI